MLITIITFYCSAQKYNIYFGDLHNHTGISDGSGTPEQAFLQARDEGHADFLAVTDHSWIFAHEWKLIADTAAKYTTATFTALRGFELTESWGHMVILNTDWYYYDDYGTVKEIYDTLAKCKSAIAQWNHPDGYTYENSPLSYYSPDYDSVINLLEIYNGKRGWYIPEYQAALDRGWHVGPSANSDNHSASWITGYEYRTAILASSVQKDSLLDAIRKHRTYATMDKNLKIYYTINGCIMGSIIPDSSVLTLRVVLSDPDTADKLDIIIKTELLSNNGLTVADTVTFAHNVTWEYRLDTFKQYNNSYYYLKVTNADDDYAITAPIWIEGNGDEPDMPKPIRPVRPIRYMLVDISGRLVASSISSEVILSHGLSPGIYFFVNNAGKKINMKEKFLHLSRNTLKN